VVAMLALLYVLPAVAALTGSVAGLSGYLIGVAGRVVTARANRARWWPSALVHPVGIAVFGGLVAVSVRRHRRGALSWKGRAVEPGRTADHPY
jgi:hypothetical protein